VSEVHSETVSVREYSKGRREMKYQDGIVEIFCWSGSDIKLTRWPNGDFKLRDENKVSYWSEELRELDQYFVD
jgi:protein associated with RNAse G/E